MRPLSPPIIMRRKIANQGYCHFSQNLDSTVYRRDMTSTGLTGASARNTDTKCGILLLKRPICGGVRTQDSGATGMRPRSDDTTCHGVSFSCSSDRAALLAVFRHVYHKYCLTLPTFRSRY